MQCTGTLQAPMSQLVGVMNNKLSSLVYVLEAAKIRRKLNLICHKDNLMEMKVRSKRSYRSSSRRSKS